MSPRRKALVFILIITLVIILVEISGGEYGALARSFLKHLLRLFF